MNKLNLMKGLLLASCALVPFAVMGDGSTTQPSTTEQPVKPRATKPSNSSQQPINPPASNQPYGEEKVVDNPDPIDLTSD